MKRVLLAGMTESLPAHKNRIYVVPPGDAVDYCPVFKTEEPS